VPNHYRGRITVDEGRPEVLRVSGWSWPGIRIEASHASPVAGRYVETVWFAAPLGLRAFTRGQLVSAHGRLMKGLVAATGGGKAVALSPTRH
jgi:hypothetical protein